MKLNIGCGQSIMEGWINIDNSMSIKLAKLPLLFSKFLLRIKIINESQFDLIFFAKLQVPIYLNNMQYYHHIVFFPDALYYAL